MGIRDGRRILGRHLKTSEDLIEGAMQGAVVRVTFPADVHGLCSEDN